MYQTSNSDHPNLPSGGPSSLFKGHVHKYPEIFFFRKYFFADAKIFTSTRSVFESFSAVHTYPIVSGDFLICSSA